MSVAVRGVAKVYVVFVCILMGIRSVAQRGVQLDCIEQFCLACAYARGVLTRSVVVSS